MRSAAGGGSGNLPGVRRTGLLCRVVEKLRCGRRGGGGVGIGKASVKAVEANVFGEVDRVAVEQVDGFLKMGVTKGNDASARGTEAGLAQPAIQ